MTTLVGSKMHVPSLLFSMEFFGYLGMQNEEFQLSKHFNLRYKFHTPIPNIIRPNVKPLPLLNPINKKVHNPFYCCLFPSF